MNPGGIISYIEVCTFEKSSLQRGMNFHLNGGTSVILLSVRPGAPYEDRVEDNGKVLLYEGHDIPNKKDGPDSKIVDQPFRNSSGTLTQNGLFFEEAKSGNNELV